jgi:hypothetical protein
VEQDVSVDGGGYNDYVADDDWLLVSSCK